MQPIREQRSAAPIRAQNLSGPVGPNGSEEVQRLSQPIGGVVLPDHHVVAAAGGYEDDGCHICPKQQSVSQSVNPQSASQPPSHR